MSNDSDTGGSERTIQCPWKPCGKELTLDDIYEDPEYGEFCSHCHGKIPASDYNKLRDLQTGKQQ